MAPNTVQDVDAGLRSGWEQIPFQVDEVFTRYLNNNASGFSFFVRPSRGATR